MLFKIACILHLMAEVLERVFSSAYNPGQPGLLLLQPEVEVANATCHRVGDALSLTSETANEEVRKIDGYGWVRSSSAAKH